MFLNRIAYLQFKKNFHKCTFANFSKSVTTLQVIEYFPLIIE